MAVGQGRVRRVILIIPLSLSKCMYVHIRLGSLFYRTSLGDWEYYSTEEVSYSEWLAGRSPRWLQVGLLGCAPGPAGES